MNRPRRLSVCYLVPGHDLLASVGPTRNVLNLARALGRHADVTVAFRRIADAEVPKGLRVLEIQPDVTAATVDDAAMRGVSIADFLSFMRALRRFVDNELRSFDVVLEKSWLLSGYVSSLCWRRGQLGVPVENIVSNPAHAARRQPLKRLRLHVAQRIAGRAMRRVPLIIAETEYLKKEIAACWKVEPDRIAVVDLGVDRDLFHPVEQSVARRELGIANDRTMLVYVGVLDYTHDLEPAIRALGTARDRGIELHVVGDGRRRDEYARIAGSAGARLVFHGRVPHDRVPAWIAAADLCLAPYDASAFASGELGYATMKIPEYLSVGRPVVSVPSGRVRTLVRHGDTGFLFDNDVRQWTAFLEDLPSRARLHDMGRAAAASKLPSWDDTADAYLALCQVRLRAMPDAQE
jgi:glycosyltransferase involved in cell wall biosynthesis